MRVATKKIAGNVDYAGVADRLKEFREKNPRAKIATQPTINEDGSAMFQTTIIADKAEESSAEATGTAFYNATEMKKPKAFEKLETISVGRALALLGYLNNGEVATTEEMDEFNAYKEDKVEQAIEGLQAAESIEELRHLFLSLGTLVKDQRIIEAKDKRKVELSA